MKTELRNLARLTCPIGLLSATLLLGCADKNTSVLAEGEALYATNCKVCHAQGINGAPILGNRKMWAPRAAQGEDVLVAHAVSGFGLMPAKGGKDHLGDEEIRKVVQFMLSKLEE